MNILFVGQTHGFKVSERAHCGVGILADLTSSILQKSTKYNFIQSFIDNNNDLEKAIKQHSPKAIIYSYHDGTTKWLQDSTIRDKYSSIPHIMIHYDIHQKVADNYSLSKFHGFKYVLTDDITMKGNDNILIVPRSMPVDGLPYLLEEITISSPIIGFQGFGLPHKNIAQIAVAFQKEFDSGTIRLHMPKSSFADPDGAGARHSEMEVRSIITKPGINIEVNNEFLTSEGIVEWLSQNDINCYFNSYLDGAGIASSPDYALAARKPIAVSRSFQFRHFWDLSPSIIYSPENNTLKKIMENGVAPLVPIYEQNSHIALIKRYEEILDKIIRECATVTST